MKEFIVCLLLEATHSTHQLDLKKYKESYFGYGRTIRKETHQHHGRERGKEMVTLVRYIPLQSSPMTS